ILISTTKVRESKTYKVKNRSEHDRTLLIEHPYRAEFKLVSAEKPAERARDVYRFEVSVPAGETASRTVTEERDVEQRVQLTNSDDQTMRFFLNTTASSGKVQDALKHALELKGKLAATQQEMAQQERELKTITDDQARLRANLKEMPQTAAAYKRYLEKFDTQETQIEKLQGVIKELHETENQQRTTLDNYLSQLTIE